MNHYEIIIMQRKIYEVTSLKCYGIKKVRLKNSYLISQILIESSQKIYEDKSLICYAIKKNMLKNNTFISTKTVKVRS